MRFRAGRVALVALALLWGCEAPEPPADAPIPTAEGTPPVATDDPPSNEAPPAEVALTSDGWGPLQVGMTREEVVAALGEDANPDAVGGPEPNMCDQFRPERAPPGMIVMLENRVLTRITLVEGSELETAHGFGVGDPAAEIRTALGTSATTTPHKYLGAPAEYFTVWSSGLDTPEPRGIVYETGVDGLVSHIHAGGPSIQYVEGCL